METENVSPTPLAHAPPPLNSDQLNYLIWRYLQEAGYGEAAVKLQRDWRVEVETLPFAKHIKGQALISLVQKGLRYHHLSLTVDEHGRQSRPLQPSMFFFGPDSAKSSTSNVAKEPLIKQNEIERGLSPASVNTTVSRKQPRDALPNGNADPNPQAAKRGRKSGAGASSERNGTAVRKSSTSMDVESSTAQTASLRDVRSPSVGENAAEDNLATSNGLTHEARMDLDAEGQATNDGGDAAMIEDVDESFPPLVPTLTNGKSRGIQVAPAKVANLGPSTTILSIPNERNLSRTMWRPGTFTVLGAQGDEFLGVWKRFESEGPSTDASPQFQDLFRADRHNTVTAAAWEPTGSMLALATYSEQECQIHLFDGDELSLIETLPASQRAVTVLKWQPQGLRLLGITAAYESLSDDRPESTIITWDLSRGLSASTPLSVTFDRILFDLDCADDRDSGIVCAAGENMIYCCRAASDLAVEERWSSLPTCEDNWTFVRCVWKGNSGSLLVAASADTARIWLPARDLFRHRAHSSGITGLEVRPRPFTVDDTTPTAEFATSSLDGTIKIWQYGLAGNILDCLHTLSIGPQYPIMGLAYSPDGFCLVGASYTDVSIWNAEYSYHLMASWQASGVEWKGSVWKEDDSRSAGGRSSLNGEGGPATPDHSLAWHSDSKRLAFGLGSQVAIIDFQR